MRGPHDAARCDETCTACEHCYRAHGSAGCDWQCVHAADRDDAGDYETGSALEVDRD